MTFRMIFRPPRAGLFAVRARSVRSTIRLSVMAKVTVVVIMGIAGCGKPPDMRDQRLAEFAQDVMKTQKEQNDRIADQSQAVVKQSQHVAEAARDLVRQDAEARREMVLVHADLISRLDKQRSVIEEARDRLEQERREIALRRNRDPVIARAVETVGLSILCLVPVAVSLYVIRQMTAGHADDAVVAELLTVELARTAPKLLALPSASMAAIEDGSDKRPSPGCSGHCPDHNAGDEPAHARTGHRAEANDSGDRCRSSRPQTAANRSFATPKGTFDSIEGPEDPDDDPDAWMGRIDFPDDDFAEDDLGPEAYPDRFRRD